MFDSLFTSFMHPWTLIIGALLVALPIIIHLINRMRYKRVRWAAMEFLLKSQRRNRRRLIIEQLLLLAMRCLLVALAGFLLARYVGNAAGFGAQTTEHIVVLQDTLSMQDHFRDPLTGEDRNCFDVAKGRIVDLAKKASQANAAQQLKLIRLSDPGTIVFDNRLNADTIGELEGKLRDLEPTYRHTKPVEGVRAARDLIAKSVEGRKMLHFVGDFREGLWNGADEDLAKELDGLVAKNVSVYLFDTAFPFRTDTQAVAPQNDNLAILDLQPETRVVSSEGLPVEFTLTAANYSPAERKNVFLNVYVDGVLDFGATMPISAIPPGTGFRHKFQIGFSKPGFNQVTAMLAGDEDSGLRPDNVRHAMVKVEKAVKVLLIDGAFPDSDKPNGDVPPLLNALAASRGYKVEVKGVDELDKGNLGQYPSIYLLNVPQLKTDKALANLEDYVKRGGRLAVFLGDKVQSAYYNKSLYQDGKGLFPVPLAGKPTEKLTEEEQKELRDNGLFKLFLRNDQHPIVAGLAGVKDAFRWLTLDRYYPTMPRSRWLDQPGGGVVEELATLPSRRSLDDYKVSAQELIKKVPTDDPKYDRYKKALERHQKAVKDSLSQGYVHYLANALDNLLRDRGDEKNAAERPSMVEFWDQPEMAALRDEVTQLRDAVQFGDPLVLVKKYGKGRVVAVLTSAGRSWNDWSGGCLASFTFPMFVADLQKFLTAAGDDLDFTVGTPLTGLKFEATRYEPRMQRVYTSGLPEKERGQLYGKTMKEGDLGEQLAVAEGKDVAFTFAETGRPGMVRLKVFPRSEGVAPAPPEELAYVFNIDTAAESDLRRAVKDRLEKNIGSISPDQGKIKLVAPDGSLEDLRQKQSDLSESPWLYLVILLLLVGEQALAVHLSFHLKGGEAALPMAAQRARSAA